MESSKASESDVKRQLAKADTILSKLAFLTYPLLQKA